MSPTGEHDFGIKQSGAAGANGGPRGVIKISADGSRCTWVTRFAAVGPRNRYRTLPIEQQTPEYGTADGTGPYGTGPSNYTSNPLNLFWMSSAINGDRDWLYVVDGVGAGGAGMQYYRIDPATGQRQSVLRGIFGDSYSVWDPIRNKLWTAGGFATTLVSPLDLLAQPAVEEGNIKCLNSSTDYFVCMRGPGDIDSHNRGGLFFDPRDGNLILSHGSFGIVRVEVHTGNSYTFSL